MASEVQRKKFEPLEPTPYGSLAEKANVQQWRSAFGLIQIRCRELESRIRQLDIDDSVILKSLSDVGVLFDTFGQRIDSLEEKVNLCYDFLVGSGLIQIDQSEEQDPGEGSESVEEGQDA